MKLLKNKKGMTLVEIIVVLLIMSILLVIMGSLILNAFSYFNKTTDQDINKRSLDSISEYVRSELLYASDVRVQEEKPDEEEWNTLYIIDGKLYKNDETVYSEGFYNHNDLVIKLRGFEQYRLDLNYSFKDDDNANVYSTNDTLELLNLKIKIESDDEFNPFSNISTVTTVTDKVKIYYQKSIKVTEEEKPVNPDEGTVADQLECLNGYNNRGLFKSGRLYNVGDMTYYGNSWWILYNGSYIWNNPPTSEHKWKKLYYRFDSKSIYEKGDIIIYSNPSSSIKQFHEDRYYRCRETMLNMGQSYAPDTDWHGNIRWELIDGDDIKSSLACHTVLDKNKTVANKLDYEELDEIDEFISGKSYAIGDYVKITSENGYEEFYLKVLESNGKNGPNTNPSSGWQRLTRDWDENSAYKKGDIAIYKRSDSKNYFIQAQKDIDKKVQMTSDDGSMNTEYWKQLD